ncbi:FAS1-like dehydratase domain-containing protein [Aromatoleum aromaticum]|uniref:FAS1-like dehydratase domain-containing protein n=1 Tax=Aromatoleum aromaticum TaxID=551760 RepID=UPI0014596B7E|nr:MaoC family dehydratase N-terminal domain-containing protein [Aromatoleum aromaticum]NMG55195.1 MaoC family dehydratase [Aromatoleum aromaticum]
MALDRSRIGYGLPAFTVTVEPAALAAFAEAIGEADPAFRGEIAPPTFMKVLEGQDNSSRRIMEALGADLKRILHAGQHFEYIAPIRAGTRVRVERSVADIYDRRDGQLEFVLIETTFSSEAAGVLGHSRQLVLVHNPARSEAA